MYNRYLARQSTYAPVEPPPPPRSAPPKRGQGQERDHPLKAITGLLPGLSKGLSLQQLGTEDLLLLALIFLILWEGDHWEAVIALAILFFSGLGEEEESTAPAPGAPPCEGHGHRGG